MNQTSPLLATKLSIPRLRPGLVSRPRLSDRLNRVGESPLTLISAPAGFGKTTLMVAWLASRPADEHAVAWLSLDQGDNGPATFWAYLIAALRHVAPGIGRATEALLRSPQPPPIDVMLVPLVNELDGLSKQVVLVLDDFHVITDRAIQDGLAFLLDHLPSTVHLVLTTRSDPDLPLARLRARGDLVEIRAGDLRFTPDEVATFSSEVMGLDLAAQDVAVLEERTEGWIAALQLLALSIQGRNDPGRYLAEVAGDHRYIIDYLVEEVLQRQPEPVRNFLLQTSILERLTGSLCDAVTGQADSKAVLARLDRTNLFLVSLDDRRQWYRYHHLFADVLRIHLETEQPDQVPDLHRRASAWYGQHGELIEAIRHAVAAQDLAQAAAFVERVAPALRRNRQEARLLEWFQQIPDEILRSRPVLSDIYAGVLLQTGGDPDIVEAHLRDAERWLGTMADPAGLRLSEPVAGDAAFRRLAGSIAVHRAGHALVTGSRSGTVIHARRALDLLAEDEHLGRGAAAALLGLAAWGNGDLAEAQRSYATAVVGLRRAGHFSDLLGCSLALADIQITQGRLHDARRTYHQALDLASEQGGSALRGTADMYLGLSELYREWNDPETAARYLQISQELGDHAGLPQHRYRWRVALAGVRESHGDFDAADDLLDEAERWYTGDLSPNVRPIAARRARLWIRLGRLADAVRWMGEQGLSSEDDLSYLREYEHITVARLLLSRATGDRDAQDLRDLVGFLDRLLRAAEGGGRTGSVIEILLLHALAHQLRGDLPAALAPLERALTLADPEGYVRIVINEGAPLAALLNEAAKQGLARKAIRRLLAAIGDGEDRPPKTQDVIDPLSDRELDVLRLLGTGLTGPEIAGELVVSLNTLRTHIKHIYHKLGVNSRWEAVQRATELGLLSRTRRPGRPRG